MKHKNKLTLDTIDTEVLNKVDLDLRFEVATLKLRECALHVPGNDNEEDAKIEAIENKLLYIQEDILESIAKIDLQNDEDFQIVKTLWLSAIDSKRDENLSVQDRLAVSLIQYAEQLKN